MQDAFHGHPRRADVRAAGSIHGCPIRIAALVPADGGNPRLSVARRFAAVLANAGDEATVSGALWVTASGKPFRVAFAARHALAGDLGGTVDPIVFRLPARSHLEEAFVDRYADGAVERPCAIGGDWTGAMAPALHDDMLARIGIPRTAGEIAAMPIDDPSAACENRSASAATLDDVEPVIPPEARRRKILGDVDVLLALDSASEIRATRVIASPNAILNAPSLDATRAALFRTEIRHCRPVAAKFVFVVSYVNDRR